MTIQYRDDAPLTVPMAIDLYNRSRLAERRPVQRCNDRLLTRLDGGDDGRQLWLGEGLVELAQVRASDKAAAGANQHQ